jgi:hypothetical protein
VKRLEDEELALAAEQVFLELDRHEDLEDAPSSEA